MFAVHLSIEKILCQDRVVRVEEIKLLGPGEHEHRTGRARFGPAFDLHRAPDQAGVVRDLFPNFIRYPNREDLLQKRSAELR